MIKSILGRGLAASVAFALLMPSAALAQADSTNTLPRGIWQPNGQQQTQTNPVAMVGKDSVTSLPCLVGFSVNCTLPLSASFDLSGISTAARQDEQTLVFERVATVLEDEGTPAGSPLTKPPVTTGCRAGSTAPSAVDDADVVNLRCDLYGNTIARMAPLENAISGVITSAMTGTTSTSLIAAPGSGLRNYIIDISCHNMDADTDTLINIQDGSGGTTFAQLQALYRGGHQKSLSFPLRQPTANTALYVANATTGASVTCTASGFKAP